MSDNEVSKVLSCNASLGNSGKQCRKKYKTEKGIKDHYDIVHKADLESQDSMLSFKSYMESYVKEIFTGSSSDSSQPAQISQISEVKLVQDGVNQTANQSEERTNTKLKLLETQYNLLSSQHKIVSTKMEDLQMRIKNVEKLHKKYCIVCWENESNYALIPCGHKITCGTCAFSILGGKRECPVCSQAVYDLLQIWDCGKEDESDGSSDNN
jgi:Zinc finger, C3HC4 type (RING finger)